MDSLTQIVLGAAVGEATLGRKVGNKALLWGAVAGTIPDLDVFARFIVDDVTAAEWHRGFSHSLLFCLLAAPVFGWLLNKLYRKKPEANFWQWTNLMFWGFVTHPLLDCHTTWGTQFFWPLDIKIAFNNIFVADPLYTVPFLLCVVLVLFFKRTNPKRRWINNLGIAVSSIYMVLTIVFKGVSFNVIKDELERQNIAYSELTTKPTPLNTMLWQATAKADSLYYIGYYSLLDDDDEIEFTVLKQNDYLANHIKNDDQIVRLKLLAEGFYAFNKKEDTLYFYDLRFGMFGFTSESEPVFRYKLIEKNAKVEAKRVNPEATNMGEMFSQLMDRVKGNK